MRRNVTWPEEDGESFNIIVCVNDARHYHRVCGELIVVFAGRLMDNGNVVISV